MLLKKETNLKRCPAETLEQYNNLQKKKNKIVRQKENDHKFCQY